MGKLIGLTGQTGAGKSTVAQLFAARGYSVIDGDRLARQIVTKGSPVLEQLQEAFGAHILLPDGSLDRAELAKAAFADAESTKLLNSMTHPAIIELCLQQAENAFLQGCSYALFDAAALLEAGFDRYCQKVVSVVAPKEERLKRILLRDGLSLTDAERRIKAQKDEQYYISHSDVIIRNFSPYDLKSEFETAIKLIEGTV